MRSHSVRGLSLEIGKTDTQREDHMTRGGEKAT